MRRQDHHPNREFPLSRWSISPVILGLGVGLSAGPLGLKVLEPHIPEDSGLIETFTQIALLVTLFCVGLRLRIPFTWRAWQLPLRLAAVTLVGTVLLVAALGPLVPGLGFLPALLLGTVLAPTDAVLACDIHAPADTDTDCAGVTLAAEGAITSSLAAPLVTLLLTYIGVGEDGSQAVLWPLLSLSWSLAGGLAVGAAIGAGMARWIRLLDADRHGDFLEELIILATAVLAYTCALALHAEGLLAALAAGLALSHGGRLRRSLQRQSLSPRALKLAARAERLATVMVMVLVGALVGSVDDYLRGALLGLALLLVVRPLTVRTGAAGLALSVGQRRPLEWFGARGAASLYCLQISINHGLGTPLARELAAFTLVFIVTSIVFSAVSALSLRRASPGAVDL